MNITGQPGYGECVRNVSAPRAPAPALVAVLAAVAAGIAAACWQPAYSLPSGLMALGAVALAGVVVTMLARSARRAWGLQAGPVLRREAALRRKSQGAACPRQVDPDAAGHIRPRAPSPALAAG